MLPVAFNGSLSACIHAVSLFSGSYSRIRSGSCRATCVCLADWFCGFVGQEWFDPQVCQYLLQENVLDANKDIKAELVEGLEFQGVQYNRKVNVRSKSPPGVLMEGR